MYESNLLVLLGQSHVHLVEAVNRLLNEFFLACLSSMSSGPSRICPGTQWMCTPTWNGNTLCDHTLWEGPIGYLNEQWAAGVFQALHWLVVTTALEGLSAAALDGEGAPLRAYFKDDGLPRPHHPDSHAWSGWRVPRPARPLQCCLSWLSTWCCPQDTSLTSRCIFDRTRAHM